MDTHTGARGAARRRRPRRRPGSSVHTSRLDQAPGSIGLRSFWADPAGPDDAAGATFRNLVVRSGDVPYRFPPPVGLAPPPGVITAWHVSQPFAPDSGTIERIPASVSSGSWQTLSTDARGLVVLFKHLPRLQDTRRPAALARVILTADRARTVPFNFGYSDEVAVFLNGKPLFAADDSYRFDEPRREGLIGLDQATLYLPLRDGRNELVLAVSDVFGGWGLMGQLPDREGVQVEAR